MYEKKVKYMGKYRRGILAITAGELKKIEQKAMRCKVWFRVSNIGVQAIIDHQPYN